MRVGCEYLTTAAQPNAAFGSCYKDCGVRETCSSWRSLRNLVANPIRAGLVTRVHDYPLWDACWL